MDVLHRDFGARSPSEVIEILRQMVLSPQADPDQLARELTGRNVQATIRQVRRVIDHYALKKETTSLEISQLMRQVCQAPTAADNPTTCCTT